MKKIVPLLTLLLLLFGLPVAIQANTTLSVSDISIIGFRSDNPDQFAFVPWVDLDGSTEIVFTDGGYDARDGTYRPTEGWITWVAPQTGVAAGTVVLSNALNGLSTAGDQIFAFNEGSVIFGINFNNTSGQPRWTIPGDLDPDPDIEDLGTNRSYLPSELDVPGGNVFVYERDNGEYIGPRTGLTVDEYKALITDDYSNWYLDNSPFNLNSTNFTIVTAVPEPISSTLFIIGGATLGLRRFWKKRKTA